MTFDWNIFLSPFDCNTIPTTQIFAFRKLIRKILYTT